MALALSVAVVALAGVLALLAVIDSAPEPTWSRATTTPRKAKR